MSELMRKSCEFCRYDPKYHEEKCKKCKENEHSEWKPTLEIGTIYFKCLRHDGGRVYQARLRVSIMHVMTDCPRCGRRYFLITFNGDTYTDLEDAKIPQPPFIPFFFYCDRMLFITKIEFNEQWVRSLPYKIDNKHHPTWR